MQTTKQSAICSFLVWGLEGILVEFFPILILIFLVVEPVYYSQNRGDYALNKTLHIVKKIPKFTHT